MTVGDLLKPLVLGETFCIDPTGGVLGFCETRVIQLWEPDNPHFTLNPNLVWEGSIGKYAALFFGGEPASAIWLYPNEIDSKLIGVLLRPTFEFGGFDEIVAREVITSDFAEEPCRFNLTDDCGSCAFFDAAWPGGLILGNNMHIQVTMPRDQIIIKTQSFFVPSLEGFLFLHSFHSSTGSVQPTASPSE